MFLIYDFINEIESYEVQNCENKTRYILNSFLTGICA